MSSKLLDPGDVLERAAKAIAEHMFPDRQWPIDFNDALRAQFRDCAYVVIRALRLDQDRIINAPMPDV